MNYNKGFKLIAVAMLCVLIAACTAFSVILMLNFMPKLDSGLMTPVGPIEQQIDFTTDSANPDKIMLSAGDAVTATESGTVSKTLTATVSPNEAKYKEIDWSIEWITPISADAIVTDYVTVIPRSDGSNVATVTAYRGFDGASMLITASTREGGYKATCTITYVGIPTSMILNAPSGVQSVYDSGWGVNIFEVPAGDSSIVDFNIAFSNILGSVGSRFIPNYGISIEGHGSINMLMTRRAGNTDDAPITDTSNYICDLAVGIPVYRINESLGTYVQNGYSPSYSGCFPGINIENQNTLKLKSPYAVENFYNSQVIDRHVRFSHTFVSYVDSAKKPYWTITVTETGSGLSHSINVRPIAVVNGVSLSATEMTF